GAPRRLAPARTGPVDLVCGRPGGGADPRSAPFIVGGHEACMVADMAADCVIGVDLGGTKVLAGAVDSDQQVHHRAQRTVLGLEQAPLLDAVVDAVDEARAAAPTNPEVVGFGIPSLIDQEHGT